VPTEDGVFEYGCPAKKELSANVLEAMLKIHCDVSGASYSVYWVESPGGKLSVRGCYVTTASQEAFANKGVDRSLPEALGAIDVSIKADAGHPVVRVMQRLKAVFIEDIGGSLAAKRAGLAEEFGLGAACFTPVTGGVMEYGMVQAEGEAAWKSKEDALAGQEVLPHAAIETAFSSGATHVIFWKQVSVVFGDKFVWGAGYTAAECLSALAEAGIESSFGDESRSMSFSVDGDDPIATAARAGTVVTVADAGGDIHFRRAALAKKFKIGNLHFVPCKAGVLEYGVPETIYSI
jgi:hypothetical protein